MSTLELGKGQGVWGANLALWVLYFAFTPVRIALRLEDNLHLVVDTVRGMVGQIKTDKELFVLVLRDVAAGREVARLRHD
jgi:hypothetical protein